MEQQPRKCLIMEELTQDVLNELLVYDMETGMFTWRLSRGARSAGSVAGWVKSDGYTAITIFGRGYAQHRLAWLYVNGEWPEQHIDHINGNKKDNRISNLRDVSRSGNLQNLKKAYCSSSSGLLGVTFLKQQKTWQSRIIVDGVRKFLGNFKTKEEAHQRYLEAKRIYHKTCTI